MLLVIDVCKDAERENHEASKGREQERQDEIAQNAPVSLCGRRSDDGAQNDVEDDGAYCKW